MKRRIVLVASLVAGLLAAVLTRAYMASKDAEVAAKRAELDRLYDTTEVLVLRRTIPEGTALVKSDLEPRKAPKLGLRGQAVPRDRQQSLVGRKVTRQCQAGEVLFWYDIEGGNPDDRGLSAAVRRKMRAMSINVSGAAAVSGMVKPNDHVDVIGTFDFPDDGGGARRGDLVTCTILQNVLVLATGRDTAKASALDPELRRGYTTVTLEVSPREAEMLAFAEQMKGRLALTLRNRNDTSFEKELPEVDFRKIRAEMVDLNNKRQSGIPGGM